MLSMFHYAVWQKVPATMGIKNARDGLERVRQNSVLCEELLELLIWCYDRISFVDKHVDLGFPCSLTYAAPTLAIKPWFAVDEHRLEARHPCPRQSSVCTGVGWVGRRVRKEPQFTTAVLCLHFGVNVTS